jgi:hypothetical protein
MTIPLVAAGVATCAFWVVASASVADDTGTLRLAAELAIEGRHESAAIEYRRLALDATNADARAAYWWAAGCAYARARQWPSAEAMLDRSEEESSALRLPAVLLRVDTAIGADDLRQARFYLDGLIGVASIGMTNDWIRGRAAAVALREGQPEKSREHIAGISQREDRERAQAALAEYARGRDRLPAIGGLLGMIPGLGYVYSGEYANALRSLLLNGLFVWGMVETAQERHWGTFAAISFFEITWYSGSIYGGIDAAHRFNRNRLDACLRDVDTLPTPQPDWQSLPAVTLRFSFQ